MKIQVETNITFGVSDVNEVPNTLQLTSANALLSYPPNQPQVKENIPGRSNLNLLLSLNYK